MNKKYIDPTKTQETRKIDTPMQAEQLCLRLIDLTADLISVLERETQLVRKPGSTDFSALTARKHALSMSLMQDMEALKQNAEYIKKTAPEQVRILKEQQDQFHRSLEVNHCAISAMKAVSEELLQTIAKKAAKKKKGPSVYNSNAGFQTSNHKESTPISVDTNL